MPRVAVLCWEECRPWVSALRQAGFSVPWVEEPKGDVHKQIPPVEPDAVVVDLTRKPEQGKAMILHLAARDDFKEIPFILVSGKASASRGLKSKVGKLIETDPSRVVGAVKSALEPKS